MHNSSSWVDKFWAKNISIIDCKTGQLLDTLCESPLLSSSLHYKMFYENCWYMLLAYFQLKRKKKFHLRTSLRIKAVASLWYTSLLSCIDASKHMHHHFCPLVTRCTVFQQNFIPAIRSLLCDSVIFSEVLLQQYDKPFFFFSVTLPPHLPNCKWDWKIGPKWQCVAVLYLISSSLEKRMTENGLYV